MEALGILIGILCILIGIALVISLAVIILKIIDRIQLGSQIPKAKSEALRKYQERLSRPMFSDLELHFGCSIPACVKSLYADGLLISKVEIEVPQSTQGPADGWHVAWFYPMDMESLKNTFFDSKQYLPIADDGFGNVYIINPRENDPVVLFHDHETGELSEACDHISGFIDRLRSHAAPN